MTDKEYYTTENANFLINTESNLCKYSVNIVFFWYIGLSWTFSTKFFNEDKLLSSLGFNRGRLIHKHSFHQTRSHLFFQNLVPLSSQPYLSVLSLSLLTKYRKIELRDVFICKEIKTRKTIPRDVFIGENGDHFIMKRHWFWK